MMEPTGERVVIIRPSFKKFCGNDACRAAAFNHLLYWIARKVKGEPAERIKKGDVSWYGSGEEIAHELDDSWCVNKVRQEIKNLVSDGLVGQRRNPQNGWFQTRHYFFGEEQAKVLKTKCDELGICLVHLGLPAEMLHLLYLVNAITKSGKCNCQICEMDLPNLVSTITKSGKCKTQNTTQITTQITNSEKSEETSTENGETFVVDALLTHSGSTHPLESVSLESGETTQPLEEKNKATTLLFPEFASESEYGASVQDNGQTSKQASSHSQKNAHKSTSKEKKVNASTKPEPPQMPPEDAKWCDETAVQIFEAMIGRCYSKTTRAQEKTEAKRLLEMEYKGELLTREHFLIACQDMFSWKFWAEHPDRKPMIRTLRRDDKIVGILDGIYAKRGIPQKGNLSEQRTRAGIKTGVEVGSSMPPQKPEPTQAELDEIEAMMVKMGIKKPA